MDDHGILVGTFREYRGSVAPGAPTIAVTRHTVGPSVLDLRGTVAAADARIMAHHRMNMGKVGRDPVDGGRCSWTAWMKCGPGRCLMHRAMPYDWLKDFAPSAEWSHGSLGRPILTKHSVDSARGDHG